MNKLFATLLASAMLLPTAASAALDETLRIKESIEINAPADAVWAKVGNFADIGWLPGVAKTELTGGNAAEAGATRTVTLQDGSAVKETLTTYDKDSKTVKYDILEAGSLPVREFSGTFLVQPNGDKTTVTWRSMFKRKDPANPGAPGQDDNAAKDAVTKMFKSGLESLKKAVEQK
jgi:mxaD protein